MKPKELDILLSHLEDAAPDPYEEQHRTIRVMYYDAGGPFLQIVFRYDSRLFTSRYHIGWEAFDDTPKLIHRKQLLKHDWLLSGISERFIRKAMEERQHDAWTGIV